MTGHLDTPAVLATVAHSVTQDSDGDHIGAAISQWSRLVLVQPNIPAGYLRLA
jgi:hypothetical protein